MIWNGMVWYGESDRLSSHWWGECIRQVLLLNHLVYHPVNQHRCGKSTIRKSCPEETTMKFHSIPELYVRLRIPFDTQTWLKKTREFYVFLRCPWSTHVMSTRWPSWNPLRKQRHRCAVVLFFVRSWMGQKCEHFFEGLRVVVEFGQTWCITRNGHIIIWTLDTTVPRNGQFSDPWGGGAAVAARELTCPQVSPQYFQLWLMQPRAATLHKQFRAVTLPNQLHAGCRFELPVVRRLGGAYHLFKGWNGQFSDCNVWANSTISWLRGGHIIDYTSTNHWLTSQVMVWFLRTEYLRTTISLFDHGLVRASKDIGICPAGIPPYGTCS